MVIALMALVLVQSRFGVIRFPAGSKDPSADISGWESVAAELERRGILDEPNAYLFTNIWYDSGQLAFATRNKLPVACLHEHDARGFAFWSRPDDYRGKTGYFVIADAPDANLLKTEYADGFGTMEIVAEFRMARNGRDFRPVTVYRCSPTINPYRFDYKMPKK